MPFLCNYQNESQSSACMLSIQKGPEQKENGKEDEDGIRSVFQRKSESCPDQAE